MQIAFPPNIRIRNMSLRLEGLRHAPFVNVDGEPFARPSLNGFWRVKMKLLAANEDEYLALTSFLTSMRGHATTALPMTTRWLPNDGNGRQLRGFDHAPEYGLDHMGFVSAPYDGFTLRAPARRRDSFIDISKPEYSHLRPGHFITLGDRLHQVVNVNALDESPTAARVSLKPNVRGNHDTGSVVVVDQLKLRAQLESADEPEVSGLPVAEVSASFVEAF